VAVATGLAVEAAPMDAVSAAAGGFSRRSGSAGGGGVAPWDGGWPVEAAPATQTDDRAGLPNAASQIAGRSGRGGDARDVRWPTSRGAFCAFVCLCVSTKWIPNNAILVMLCLWGKSPNACALVLVVT